MNTEFSNYPQLNQRKEICPAHPDYTQPAKVILDGNMATWYENDHPTVYRRYMSGSPNCQSTKCTSLKNYGPIPEGEYVLKRGSGEDYGNYQKMSWWNKINPWLNKPWYERPESWGNSRIPIHPVAGTDTLGRTNMYVHGGKTLGSAGCVDMGYNNNSFYQDFINYDDDLPLIVKYPPNW